MRKTCLLAGLCFSLTLTYGCSSDGILAPTGSRAEFGSPRGQTATLSSHIGPEGGTIQSGGAVLVIPPGALSSQVDITVQCWQADGKTYCDLAPEGLSLGLPATLSLPKPTGAAPGVVYHIVTRNSALTPGIDLGGTDGGLSVSLGIIHLRPITLEEDLSD
jgi:hypothetical protein